MHKVAVKLEGLERSQKMTGILHIAAGSFLLLKAMELLLRYENVFHFPIVLLFIIAALSIGYGVLKKWKKPLSKYNVWIRAIQMLCFGALGAYELTSGKSIAALLLFAWAMVLLFLMITERKAAREPFINFSKENVMLPGIINNKKLDWIAIQDVVIRPDYITIFKKDESFLQYEVLKNMDAAAIENIRQFCNQHTQQAATTATL